MQVVFSGSPSPPSPTVFSLVLTRDRIETKITPKNRHLQLVQLTQRTLTVSEGLGKTGAKSIVSAAGVKPNNLVLHVKYSRKNA